MATKPRAVTTDDSTAVTTDNSTEAPYGYKADGTPRLRAPVSGPRVTRAYLLYRVVDGELDIVNIIRRADEALEAMDASGGTVKFRKIEV